MNPQRAVVDSSGWIELFTNGPLADRFLALLEAEANLIVPAISILEVFKWVLREHSEAKAIQAAAVMQRGLVVDFGHTLPRLEGPLAIESEHFSNASLFDLLEAGEQPLTCRI